MDQSVSVWNRNFAVFIASQAASFTGKALLRFALPLYLLLETGSPALMGGMLAISTVPSILFAPIAGVMVDHFRKNRLLATVNVLTFLGVFLFLNVRAFVGVIPATAMVMIVFLTADSLTALTSKTIVPAIIPPGTLVKANSISFLAITISLTLTPIFGGFFFARFGLVSILIASMVLLLLAATLNVLTHVPFQAHETHQNVVATVVTDVLAGVRFASKEKPSVGGVIVRVNFLYCMTLFPLTTVTLPILVMNYFSLTEEVLGITKAVVSLGGIAGVMILNALGRRATVRIIRPLLIVSSLILVPLAAAFLWSSSDVLIYAIMIVVLFFTFAFSAMLVIICRSHFGEKSPPQLIGQVMGLNSVFVLSGVAIGGYVYGLLFDRFIHTPGWIVLLLFVVSLFTAYFGEIELGEQDVNDI